MGSQFRLGIDVFLNRKDLQDELLGKRVAFLGHPASLTSSLKSSLDELKNRTKIQFTSAFGPQHGMRGDKQDNMIESDDYLDPGLQIPVFSLYGKSRRPTKQMMDTFDVLMVDLQDLGCRIYTFITTLKYMLEACARDHKDVWILDRPNPAGRPVEGFALEQGWESFVGAAPIPMRHGLTLGELALYFVQSLHLDLNLNIVTMEGYHPDDRNHGWPQDLPWVNPSPNAANVNMARVYPGSVLLEGTTLSEGRGTTRPLEIVGTANLNMEHVFSLMNKLAPEWLEGVTVRPCFFEPTFHKYVGQLCQGLHFHTDVLDSYRHERFQPFRIFCLLFKAIKLIDPSYALWRDFSYEYEFDRKAIDVINGGTKLRTWVDDSHATIGDLEELLKKDEDQWRIEREGFFFY